ncbi:MAG: alpha/beta fold hydrolase [Chloroflexota bacterium]
MTAPKCLLEEAFVFHNIDMQRKKIWVWIYWVGLCGFILLNWISFNHARRMTRFVPSGERTKSPEELSTLEKLPLLFFGITVPRPQNEDTPADYGLAYETEVLRSWYDGRYLEGWWVPAAPESALGTIIMFHGYAVAKSSLLTETAAFHDLGYNVFLVDFRGSGGSCDSSTTIGYEDANDVAWAYQFVEEKEGEHPIILYGMSMGGAAVMRAIAITDIQPDGIIVEAVFDEMLTTVKNRFHTMGFPAFPAAHLLVFWGGAQHGFNGFEHNPADYAADITIPVLVLHGANDPRATLAEGQHIYEQLASPHKEIIIFDGAKHESTIGVDRGLWELSINSFLAEIK